MSFIEHQNLWIAQNGACDGDSLALAAGKPPATFADRRVIAQRKFQNQVVHLGCPGCRFHFGVGGVELAQSYIFADGGVEEDGVLEDYADARAHRGQRHAADIVSIECDAAFLGIVEAHQKTEYGAFSATAGPDKGDRGSRRKLEGHIFEVALLARRYSRN